MSNPAPQSQEDELDGLLGTVYKQEAGKIYATGAGSSNIYYNDRTHEIKAKLKSLIAHHDAQKKAELLAGLPKSQSDEISDHDEPYSYITAIGFNDALSEVRAAIEAVYGD
jgi:hypothetical protein